MFRQDVGEQGDQMDQAGFPLQEGAGSVPTAEMIYEWGHSERVREVRVLADLGLGPRIIAELTTWPSSLVSKLSEKAGRRSRGGKARTELANLVKMPLVHAAISQFVQAVEHQAEFWGDTRLTSRIFVRAHQFAQSAMPDALAWVPASGLYSIATETMQKTVRTTTCRTCKYCYAQMSLESRLTGLTVFDCPLCRLLNMMLPSQRRSIQNCVPTSFADLNLREPFKRFLARPADPADVRAVFALAYGAAAQGAH